MPQPVIDQDKNTLTDALSKECSDLYLINVTEIPLNLFIENQLKSSLFGGIIWYII